MTEDVSRWRTEGLATSRALHARVRELITSDTVADRDFEALALDVARYQAAHVAPFARLLEARGVDVHSLSSIASLPAIPCDVFRLKRVAAHPPDEDVRVFRTSGTTLGVRGEHPFRDLATYEEAAMTHAQDMLWPDGAPDRIIALAPSSNDVPDSSLGFMIDLFARVLGAPISHHFELDRGLDMPSLRRAVASANDAGDNVLFCGTSFAYVYMLDALGAERLALPARSTAMLTGGFKGRTREVAEGELRAMLGDRLAIGPERVVGEYGMTELSSQLYEARLLGDGSLYRPPSWVRVTAVDPVSLDPVAEGEVGIARIVDLANVDSAIAIQTMDRVRVSSAGVELLGRLPGATPRGCSLAIEAIVEGTGA